MDSRDAFLWKRAIDSLKIISDISNALGKIPNMTVEQSGLNSLLEDEVINLAQVLQELCLHRARDVQVF